MFEFLLTSSVRVRSKLTTFVFNKTQSNETATTTSCNNLTDTTGTKNEAISPRKLVGVKTRASKSLSSPKTSSKSTNLVCSSNASNENSDNKDEDDELIQHDGFVICRACVIKEFTPSPYDQNSLSLKVYSCLILKV